MLYGINRGELALIACRNGYKTAEMIKDHLVRICARRKSTLSGKKDLGCYEKRQMDFIMHVEKNGIRILETETKEFNDGELKPKIKESISGKDVYVIQNTLDPRNPRQTSINIMELLFMLDAARRSDSCHLSIILPYMSYCKQERRTGREAISAKTFIDLIERCGAERLFTMDLHAPSVEGFSSAGSIRIQNLYASPLLIDYLQHITRFNGVFIAPDPGAGKMVKHYQKVTGMPMALGYKYRNPDSMHQVDEQKLLGDVSGKDVAIIDDQSASSGTLLNMAKAAKDAGAKKVYAGVAHAMLLGDAEEKFTKAVKDELLAELITTNTLMQPDDFIARNRYIKVLDALGFFAEAIYETHLSGSISGLYEPKLRASMFGESHRS